MGWSGEDRTNADEEGEGPTVQSPIKELSTYYVPGPGNPVLNETVKALALLELPFCFPEHI